MGDEAAREQRRATVDGVKREIIRAAAKKVFAEAGLDRASVREIARAAGYTTGAIYFHYAGKEALYADLVSQSLDGLQRAVGTAAAGAGGPVATVTAAFRAMAGFYDEHPRDLELSLYLLQGMRPRGLSPALNRELNAKLMAVLAVFRAALARAGVADARLDLVVAALFSQIIGTLVAAHTGRLRLIGVDLDAVVAHHVASIEDRLLPDARP